jgi:hypothetical protein
MSLNGGLRILHGHDAESPQFVSGTAAAVTAPYAG